MRLCSTRAASPAASRRSKAGVTRAKKLVVLAGSCRTLAVAVRSKGSGRRHTALAYRLRG